MPIPSILSRDETETYIGVFKFSVGNPRLPHTMSSSSSLAASVYYKSLSIDKREKFIHSVSKTLHSEQVHFIHTLQIK